MRLLTAFLVMALVLLEPAWAQKDSTPRNGISLVIAVAKAQVKVGSPLVIDVTLLNKSDHEISFTREIHGRDLRVQVRYPNGRLAPDTELGRVFNGHEENVTDSSADIRLNIVYVTAKPGESIPWRVDLTQLYDMG